MNPPDMAFAADTVAHALLRAASRLLSTLVHGPATTSRAGVGTIANAARKSACARMEIA